MQCNDCYYFQRYKKCELFNPEHYVDKLGNEICIQYTKMEYECYKNENGLIPER